jgi:hypothetical protein
MTTLSPLQEDSSVTDPVHYRDAGSLGLSRDAKIEAHMGSSTRLVTPMKEVSASELSSDPYRLGVAELLESQL